PRVPKGSARARIAPIVDNYGKGHTARCIQRGRETHAARSNEHVEICNRPRQCQGTGRSADRHTAPADCCQRTARHRKGCRNITAARIHIAEADPGERGMYVLIDGDTDRSSYHRSVVNGLYRKVYPCCITLGRYTVVTHLVLQTIQTVIIEVGAIGKASIEIQYYRSVNRCYGQRSRQRISFRVRIVGQYITGCRYVFRYRYVVVHRYRSSIDASNQIERISVLYVVIGQCSAIFQLCAAKEKLLLR